MQTDQHRKFLGRLAESRVAVEVVAGWLRSRGRAVEVPATRFAPSAVEAEAYADHGDILLDGKRVEVKRLSRQFSSRADWPFPRFFVTSESSAARAGDEVAAYVVLSNDLRTAGIVTPSSRPKWYLHLAHNRLTGKVERFVACPLDCVHFRSIR